VKLLFFFGIHPKIQSFWKSQNTTFKRSSPVVWLLTFRVFSRRHSPKTSGKNMKREPMSLRGYAIGMRNLSWNYNTCTYLHNIVSLLELKAKTHYGNAMSVKYACLVPITYPTFNTDTVICKHLLRCIVLPARANIIIIIRSWLVFSAECKLTMMKSVMFNYFIVYDN